MAKMSRVVPQLIVYSKIFEAFLLISRLCPLVFYYLFAPDFLRQINFSPENKKKSACYLCICTLIRIFSFLLFFWRGSGGSYMLHTITTEESKAEFSLNILSFFKSIYCLNMCSFSLRKMLLTFQHLS